ncbi:MAG: low molecular weight phosphotyrosine protein phosphatase [Verrucomicrobiota bacterium]|nr:low molecular weight phosphotyrosine protein phosphatase [Verrucomicrobiota bacterium]
MISVLFVCQGNICRSPTLAAVLDKFAKEKKLHLTADSCGIGWVHLGEHPNPQMFQLAKEKGILIDHRAQQFQDSFFEEFDHIFAVDEDILEQLKLRSALPAHRAKLQLATAYSKKHRGRSIPDPYYLSKDGFHAVMEMILDACHGIIDELSL